jgi:hypothetical protein
MEGSGNVKKDDHDKTIQDAQFAMGGKDVEIIDRTESE